MNHMWIILVALIAAAFSVLIGKIFDRGKRIDKGFAYCYWHLSYRRRFKRTLWTLPILIIVLFLLQVTYESYFLTIVMAVVLGMIFMIQAVVNYRKWKEEEQWGPKTGMNP